MKVLKVFLVVLFALAIAAPAEAQLNFRTGVRKDTKERELPVQFSGPIFVKSILLVKGAKSESQLLSPDAPDYANSEAGMRVFEAAIKKALIAAGVKVENEGEAKNEVRLAMVYDPEQGYVSGVVFFRPDGIKGDEKAAMLILFGQDRGVTGQLVDEAAGIVAGQFVKYIKPADSADKVSANR